MATASSITISTNETDTLVKPVTCMTCPYCKKEFTEPKLLPCQHSFCTPCLLQHQGEVEERQTFCCPTCQIDVQLHGDNIENLPDNYLYDIVKVTQSSNVKCVPCSHSDMVTIATHTCLDCGDALCQSCNKWHCKLTLTKHHVVVTLEDLEEGKFKEELSARKLRYCDLHSTDEHRCPLISYCVQCESVVCAECIQADHGGHHFKKFNAAREQQQRLFIDKYAGIYGLENNQEKRISNIEKYVTDTKLRQTENETDVYDRATEMYAMIDQIKEEKLAELKTHYEKELQYLNDLLNEEKNKIKSFQASVEFIQTFLSSSSDTDFLYHCKDIKTRMESCIERENRHFCRNVLTFRKQDTAYFKPTLRENFGIMESQERVVKQRCQPGSVKEKFRKKFNDGGQLSGLASENEEIYMVDKNNIKVMRYNGRWPTTWNKTTMPFDVCARQNELYVTCISRNSRKLVTMVPYGNIQKEIRLPEDDQDSDSPLGVAVSNNKTCFIASYWTDRIYKLKEDDERLTIFITLTKTRPIGIEGPRYLCLTPKDELVVSNCDSSNIQVYSKVGELLWQYSGKEEGFGLQYPGGVCCDQDGLIYVADHRNSRIQVISDSKLIARIPIDGAAKNSNRMALALTQDGVLVYGYEDNLVKLSFCT